MPNPLYDGDKPKLFTGCQVHRFGDDVAVYLGKGNSTVYMDAASAEHLAVILTAAVADLRAQPDFSKSGFKTKEFVAFRNREI